MKSEYKVSLITATFNSEKYLAQAIDSARTQSYPDLEHIIIDGGSKDSTIDIIKNYGGTRSVKWISEPDKGIYDALNKGIELSSGDIIGIVHSDDFLAHSKIIEKIAETFKSRSVDGVYGDLHYVNEADTTKLIRNWRGRAFNPALINKGWMPAHPTLFLRKEVFIKHGFYNLSYKIAADYDFILRIFNDDRLEFYYLPEVITKMRVGGASNRSIKNIILKSSEDLRAIKTNGLKHPYYTLVSKNVSKISQFFKK